MMLDIFVRIAVVVAVSFILAAMSACSSFPTREKEFVYVTNECKQIDTSVVDKPSYYDVTSCKTSGCFVASVDSNEKLCKRYARQLEILLDIK